MIWSKVDDDLDAVLVGRSDEVVKVSPGITRVTEVFFDTFEVACLVTVIRSGGITVAVGNVCIEIIDRRRYPDCSHTQTCEVRHFLLNTGQISTPVKTPVSFGRVVEPGALRRIVV